MSLLDAFKKTFIKVEKTATADGYGGTKEAYVEGEEFQADAVLDTSIEARVAAVQGLTALYTITTGRDTCLKFHDIIMRKTDNKVFRITSDGEDKETPSTAGLDMRQVTAEEWELPGELEEAEEEEEGVSGE